ncbi:hypothetical protein ACL9RF_07135 [Sphingobacterium sp. Mn56C]|uniref:hypothetical protein n=1 Tax=Sphingobacterium sp. Mn56C TaxID=3395261 RepID=UPI003BC7E4FE
MKRKTILAALFASLYFFVPTPSKAQQQETPVQYKGTSTKFAILLSKAGHYPVAVSTAESMAIKKNNYAFEIVVMGELAKELADNKSLLPFIQKAEELGVKTVVCEQALAFFNTPKAALHPSIQTTANAWIYLFELKDKNYNSLSIQ